MKYVQVLFGIDAETIVHMALSRVHHESKYVTPQNKGTPS